MRKKISLILTFTILLTLLCGTTVFAEGNNLDDIIINRGSILSFQDLATLKVIIDNEEPMPDEAIKELIVQKIIEKESNFIVTPLYTIWGYELNPQELLLVAAFPYEAVHAYYDAQIADSQSRSWYHQSTQYQGNGDAFRHGYWNALMTNNIGSSMAKGFADAHEYYSSGVDKEMDLYNNAQGRSVGASYNHSTSATVLKNRISAGQLRRIVNGKLVATDSSGQL